MKKLLLLATLFSYKFAISQNNFSQFFNAPLSVNPSNTGKFIGGYRMGGVYRNQPERFSPSSMYIFFTDVKILPDRLQNNDIMAIGISALGEKNTYTGLKNSNLLVSTAYSKSLNQDGSEEIIAGFQVDFAHKKIQPQVLVFPNQMISWSYSGFTGINPFQSHLVEARYIDLNVGLNYQKLFRTQDLLTTGLSVFHANSPSKNDGDIVFSLSPQFSFQFEFEKKIGNSNKLLFALIVNNLTNEKAFDNYYVGSTYQMQINDSKYDLNLGCLYRANAFFSNSIVPLFGFKYENLNMNFSYDMAFLNKSTYKRRGGLEVSVTYIGNKNVDNK